MQQRNTVYRIATVVLCLMLLAIEPTAKSQTAASSSSTTATKKRPAAKKKSAKSASNVRTKKPASRSHARSARSRAKHNAAKPPSARSIKLNSAFLASAQLRPMAQQLASTRSPAAYLGVLSYAQSHPGEPAAAAYLSLGHAYLEDHRYPEAAANLTQAKRNGEALADYADYLAAQAAIQANRGADAYPLLDRFADRYPDSIFVATAPVMLANAHLQQNDPRGALAVLQPLIHTTEADETDFRYALGRAYQLSGDASPAASIYRSLYTAKPLAYEAAEATAQLQAMGLPLSAAERKTHADTLFNAKRYSEAGAEYNAIGRNNPQLSPADRDALTLYAAVCDFKLKQLSRRDVEKLPDTADDTAALKLYMLAELSRDEDDRAGHDAIIAQMVQRFPTSRWLEEAL
ncbi:MAG TPA: lytic transglycosylase, partial [Acidobacteriaceae bacterium]|nr:lytic transglycosylase [Acidobacteriaceae bacterium]